MEDYTLKYVTHEFLPVPVPVSRYDNVYVFDTNPGTDQFQFPIYTPTSYYERRYLTKLHRASAAAQQNPTELPGQKPEEAAKLLNVAESYKKIMRSGKPSRIRTVNV